MDIYLNLNIVLLWIIASNIKIESNHFTISYLSFLLIIIIFYFLWLIIKKITKKYNYNDDFGILMLLLNIPLISSFLFWFFNKKFNFKNLLLVIITPSIYLFYTLIFNDFYGNFIKNYLHQYDIIINNNIDDINFYSSVFAYYLVIICFYISKKIYLKNKSFSYIFFIVFSIIFLSLWTIYSYNYLNF